MMSNGALFDLHAQTHMFNYSWSPTKCQLSLLKINWLSQSSLCTKSLPICVKMAPWEFVHSTPPHTHQVSNCKPMLAIFFLPHLHVCHFMWFEPKRGVWNQCLIVELKRVVPQCSPFLFYHIGMLTIHLA